MKAYLSPPAALDTSVRERRQRLGADLCVKEQAEDIGLARLLALCGDARATNSSSSGPASRVRCCQDVNEPAISATSAVTAPLFATRLPCRRPGVCFEHQL